MVLLLVIWLIILFIFFTWGISFVNFLRILTRDGNISNSISYDEFFFIGFFSLSAITGILSIFFPLGKIFLLIICVLTVLFSAVFYIPVKLKISAAISEFKELAIIEKAGIWFLILFVLSAVVQKITFEDTHTYHAQSIQWIQKYAVVPGLGNLRGAFAFNNMFFTISALFSFTVRNSLIFPLNGLCFVVLGLKLLSLYRNENKKGTLWKSIFYILTLLIALLILLPNLNTPAPDIICDILTIFAFVLLLKQNESKDGESTIRYILMCLLVFSCITYKISSLFLLPALLFSMRKDVLKKIFISVIVGALIVFPFLVRNYFLSGYVIYPFPAIDIFNVDWKIPLSDISAMKLEIESFAKMKGVAYDVVDNMKLHEWLGPWFKSKSFNDKLILAINCLSFIPLIIMILKREVFYVKLQLLIYLNLLFWMSTAPDLRFVYGFLFLGFSSAFAYLIKLIELSPYVSILRFRNIALVCLLIIIFSRRINFVSNTIFSPPRWIIPAPIEKVETLTLHSNFEYRIPAKEGDWCYNTEIPCVSYPLNDVVMRGENIQSGFKIAVKK